MPAWVEPAVWVFLVLLAVEVAAFVYRAWRGPQQMRTLINYTVQVRQAIETLTQALDAGLASNARDLLVGLNDLPDIAKTLHAIDERGAEVTRRG